MKFSGIGNCYRPKIITGQLSLYKKYWWAINFGIVGNCPIGHPLNTPLIHIGMCSVGENTEILTLWSPTLTAHWALMTSLSVLSVFRWPLTPTFTEISVIYMILASAFTDALTHSVTLRPSVTLTSPKWVFSGTLTHRLFQSIHLLYFDIHLSM
jgi:hypothetical protein